MSEKLKRSEQREQVLQLLYEKTFHEEPVDDLLELANIARDFTPTAFISDEVNGVVEHISEIDSHIAENCKKWSVNRIPKVPMCIMRIAVYEMLFCDDIDTGVSINEAVELSKKYASPDDKSYINGILGAIAKGIEK